jgi:hypothetical protein
MPTKARTTHPDANPSIAVRHSDVEFMAERKLRERGWTPALIRDFLGAPDTLKRNPYYAKAAPMRLYAVSRIEAAEQLPAFLVAQERASRRAEAANTAAGTRRAILFQRVAAMEIRVEELSLERVQRRAIAAFNARNEMAEPATEASAAAFLDRIMVNYVRHHLTAYDAHLEELAGRTGVRAAVRTIRRRIYATIAHTYPALAAECGRQMEDRGLVSWRDDEDPPRDPAGEAVDAYRDAFGADALPSLWGFDLDGRVAELLMRAVRRGRPFRHGYTVSRLCGGWRRTPPEVLL